MTADRAEREREAMAAAGLAPVPFTRTTPADVAGCEGFTMLNGRVPGLCHRCERYGHSSRSYVTPALQLNNGAASCDNWRPLLSADQIAAVDETQGTHSPDASVSQDAAFFRALARTEGLTPEQVAAADEMAGLCGKHGSECAPAGQVGEPLHVGPASAGCTDGQQHTSGVST